MSEDPRQANADWFDTLKRANINLAIKKNWSDKKEEVNTSQTSSLTSTK